MSGAGRTGLGWWMLILPAFLLLVVFYVAPIAQVLTISVTEPETIMTFQLTEDTPSQVVLTGLVSSDAMSQLVDIQVAGDGRSITFMNKNTVEYLIQLAFLAYDEKSGDSFICDPQVINTPRPPTA